ncbi:MAG TPA: 5'-3' exonuclease [Bacillus sp. (in: firmicutes)]|nr:5'-3' exonuclease [Bacillus sp. (in: firmicutes)]
MSETLLLIDGFNLLSRCYFATAYGREEESLAKNSAGLYINGLRVMMTKMVSFVSLYQPTHFVVAWDVKRNETNRKSLFEGYKETRAELPAPLIQQYETLTSVLEALGVSQMSLEGHEADDVIGALAKKWSKEKEKPCFIYSNDRDLFQLLDEHVSQIVALKRQGDTIYSLKHFRDEFGIEPSQWIDVKALLGDKSDNVPGVAGVGDKAALPLVQQYGSIEGLYNQLEELDPAFNRYKKKLQAGEEMAKLSKVLVTIETEMPEIQELRFDEIQFSYNQDIWQQQCKQLELNIKIV